MQSSPDAGIRPKVIPIPKVHSSPRELGNLKTTGNSIQRKSAQEPTIRIRPEVMFEKSKVIKTGLHQHASMNLLQNFSEKLDVGFSRIPNELLMKIIQGNLTKQETQVMVSILRLTLGFNKEKAPISIGVLSQLTGLQSSRISLALNKLISLDLIHRKSGNINSPNVLRILFSRKNSKIDLSLDRGGRGIEPHEVIKPDVNNKPDVRTQPQERIRSNVSREIQTEGVRSETDLNYIHNKNIDTLSNSSIIHSYFDQLPPNKSSRERKHYGELRENYSENELEVCLEYLQENGELKTGEICHSPFSYLSQAINEALKIVKKVENEKIIKKQKDIALQAEKKRMFEVEEKQEENYLIAKKAFNDEYPDQVRRREILASLIDSAFVGSGITPPYEVAQRIAILEWHTGALRGLI